MGAMAMRFLRLMDPIRKGLKSFSRGFIRDLPACGCSKVRIKDV
jgi:hypothetical protein